MFNERYVLGRVPLCDPRDSSRQYPLSMTCFRQEYWSGLPFPPLGDLPDPGIEAASLASPTLAGGFFTTATPGKLTLDFYLFVIKKICLCLVFLPLLNLRNSESI